MPGPRLAYSAPLTQVAYCEPYAIPWSHTAPAGAVVTLTPDDPHHVALVEGDGFEAYRLNKKGRMVQP